MEVLTEKIVRKIALFLFLAIVLGLTGCGKPEEEPWVLWVVTEKSAEGDMNEQVGQVIEAFEADHPGLHVQLDILPQDAMERELTLKRLRTRIMAGKGPDVFLLPSCSARTFSRLAWDFSEKRTLNNAVEPLFLDPVQSMRNGVFLDISGYYDRDAALGKEALQQTVMDAGILDGRRYILPLRYDFPALYVDVEKVRALGIDPSALDGSAMDLMDTALTLGDPLFASGAEPGFCRTGSGFALLPPVLNYDAGRVTLEESALADFLEKYQALEVLAAGEHSTRRDPSIAGYLGGVKIIGDYVPGQDFEVEAASAFGRDVPITVGMMSSAPCAAAIGQVEKREVRMLPLRASDGSLAATVTYYGAVGAGCGHPEEAYDFLRRFLLEEYQWELNRPLKQDIIKPKVKVQYHPVADGWPVRAKGSVWPLWSVLRRAARGYNLPLESGLSRSRLVMNVRLADEDIPLLEARIDRVYFGHTLEQSLAETIRSLNDPKTGAAQEVDLDDAAAQLIRELTWQMMEG